MDGREGPTFFSLGTSTPPFHPSQLLPTQYPPPAVNTNGNITVDEEMGEVIQLQGDQRQLVKDWLLDQEVVSASDVDRIVIHGF